MIKKKQYDLARVIYADLVFCGKIQLILLLMIMISALLTVYITYQTRCIIIDRENLLLERNKLDLEWNNLILERKKLFNLMIVEDIAINKLHMHYVDPLDNLFE